MQVSPAGYVDGVWPTVKPLLESALAHGSGEYEIEDILSAINEQKMQLGIVHEDDRIVAAFVTEIICYPRKKMLRVTFAGGERMAAWLPLVEEYVRSGAEAIGAELYGVHGRLGWAKTLRRLWNGNCKTTAIVAKETES